MTDSPKHECIWYRSMEEAYTTSLDLVTSFVISTEIPILELLEGHQESFN